MDQEILEEETCSICLEPLNNVPEQVQGYDSTSVYCSIPVLPNCNHRFHWFCVNVATLQQIQAMNHPTCPLCRASTIEGVLPTNHILVNTDNELYYLRVLSSSPVLSRMNHILLTTRNANETLNDIVSNFHVNLFRRLVHIRNIVIYKTLIQILPQDIPKEQYRNKWEEHLRQLRFLVRDRDLDVPGLEEYNEDLYKIILDKIQNKPHNVTISLEEHTDLLLLVRYIAIQMEIHKDHPERNLPITQRNEFWKNALAFEKLLHFCHIVAQYNSQEEHDMDIFQIRQEAFLDYCGARPEDDRPETVEERIDLLQRASEYATQMLHIRQGRQVFPVFDNDTIINFFWRNDRLLQNAKRELLDAIDIGRRQPP